MSEIPATERTQLTRAKHKGRSDRDTVNAILDAALVGQLAWADDSGQPFVVPIAFARDGDRLLFHGSTGAGSLRQAAAGRPVCFSVTLLEGLVLARSAFESSMHYRSVNAFGTCRQLDGDEQTAALEIVTQRLLPGRAASLRPMTAKEVAATLVLELPLVEVSAKVSDAWPHDEAADLQWPVWAGVVPLQTKLGQPLAAPDLAAEFAALPTLLDPAALLPRAR